MNKEEIKKLAEELTLQVEKIKESLKSLNEDLDKIKNGDQNGPYWNGNNAHQCMKTALTQVECNEEILKNLEKDVTYIQSLVK